MELNYKDWLDETYDKLLKKMKIQCERTGDKVPFFPKDGRYIDCPMPDGIAWWTNGFWPGMMWQMYNATKDEMYKTMAEKAEDRLERALHDFEKLHHDVGFMYHLSSVANWKVTGSEKSLNRGLHAANLLAGRFNPVGGYLRAWNVSHWGDDVSGWAIIDSLLNIPILYWASKEIKDPRYEMIANIHANTLLKSIVRPDGSCNHIAEFNSTTGEFVKGLRGQGYEEGSSWSRGQSWAVYGYAIAYKYTNNEEFLNAAKSCAHYCISNYAVSAWLPLVDFRAPKEPIKYDSGSAMITACGLLEIAEHVPELEKDLYIRAAISLLKKSEETFADWDLESDGIMGNGTTMYHDERLANMAFVYNDYFFTEAILKLKSQSMDIW